MVKETNCCLGFQNICLISKEKKLDFVNENLNHVSESYSITAQCLQLNPPFNNPLLWGIPVIDPDVYDYNATIWHFCRLLDFVTNFLLETERSSNYVEIRNYQISESLPNTLNQESVRVWIGDLCGEMFLVKYICVVKCKWKGMWGLRPVCKTNQADFTDWISFLPCNIMEEIHTNPESLFTNTFYQYEKTEKIMI